VSNYALHTHTRKHPHRHTHWPYRLRMGAYKKLKQYLEIYLPNFKLNGHFV